MSCQKCPCADICLGWSVFCDWAAADPPDPIQLRHICARSALKDIPPPSYPSISTQVGNFARSMRHFVRSGLKLSDKGLYRRRRAICQACPYVSADKMRCTVCGCLTALKPWVRSEACPKGFW